MVMVATKGARERAKAAIVCAGAGLGGILLTGGAWQLAFVEQIREPGLPNDE